MNTVRYPVFRCYSDLNTWFKIISSEEFTELKRIGKYYSISHFKASIHPERMFIGDLVNFEMNTILPRTEKEFEETRQDWEKQLVRIEI